MALGGMSSAAIRIVLSGQQMAIAGLAATKAEVNALKRSVIEYGEATAISTKRSWAMNQALFTMRRYAYMGTLAFTGLVAMSLKWGVDFEATMQGATLALLPMMKNTNAVKTELQTLFNMAKYNPFTFGDMTTAFRRMYIGLHPIGISTHEINRTLKDMVDALSAAGSTSPGQLNRVAVALQHLAYAGRLTGFAVNQLMRDGLPIVPALNKELGITGEQLHNISKMGIPASVALEALNRYIEETPGLAGAAARQARTLGGELATLHDNIAQTVGALISGRFQQATGRGGILQNVNDMFLGIQRIILRQHGKISLDQVFGVIGQRWTWAKPLITDLKMLIDVGRILYNVFRYGILPAFYLFLKAISMFAPILHPILAVLKFLTRQMWLMVPLLTILITLWIVDRIVMFRAAMAQKTFAESSWLVNFALKRTYTALRMQEIATIALGKATRYWGIFMGRIWVQQGGGAFKALTGWEKRVRMLGLAIRTQLIPALMEFGAASYAFLLTPAGWILLIVAAVILLVTGLVILYFKWKWFHNLVNSTFRFIWQHWKLMSIVFALLMPMFAVILLMARLVYNHWDQLNKLLLKIWNSTLKPIYNWLVNVWNGLIDHLRWAWDRILDTVRAITGWFTAMIRWIDKAIKKMKEMLGLWKKIPGATWLVGAVKHVAGAVGSFAMQPGMLTADTGNSGGAIALPQNQIASALQNAHKTSPKIETTVHNHVHLDGKEVASNSAKHRQKAAARK